MTTPSKSTHDPRPTDLRGRITTSPPAGGGVARRAGVVGDESRITIFAAMLALLLQAAPAFAQDLTGAPCLPVPGGPPCPQQQGSMTSPDSATGAATMTAPTTGTPTTGVPTIRSPGRQPAPQFIPGQPQTFPPTQTVPTVVLPQTPPTPLKPGVAPPDAVATPPAVPQKPAVTTQPGLAPQPQIPTEFQRTEFQEFVAQSVGRYLPLFGYNLFEGVPTTFAPVDNVPVTPDYVVGPGDELLIRAWGQVDIDYRAVVDRNGMINIPRVGNVTVAGIRYQDLSGYLRNAIGRIFRNFELLVTLGQLRSIQIFVVGQAQRPGSYTVSSLSTLVNAVFASGRPLARGSMRRIQLKRGDKMVTEFDLYDLLLRGDKSKDAQLLPGDVIYIPPVGRARRGLGQRQRAGDLRAEGPCNAERPDSALRRTFDHCRGPQRDDRAHRGSQDRAWWTNSRSTPRDSGAS